jgi:lipopolysaccharide transport system ATP-binding protein
MAYSVVAADVSKRYQIGQLQQNGLLYESLINWCKHPFKKRQKMTQSLWALRNVSFQVREGEVVGIIGRNGAGKSTLLKVLSRITHATSGQVTVRGRVAALLEVGTGFHGELTGRENIFLNGSILGMRKEEIAAKLDAIVAFAGVEQFLDTPVKRYSSGMFLRLGFAVAAHLEPDILVIDEVLAVGDVGFQKKCLNAMDGLRSGGRTVLFVSHNMAAVENLCSRVIWIDHGQVREDGDPKEIIEAYMGTFSESPQLSADLQSAKSRGGNGDVRFTRIDFLDSQKQPLRVIRSGDSIVMRLSYFAVKQILRPDFEVGVYTDLGTLVTRFSTWANSHIPFLPAGNGYVDLRIDCFSFLPGRYYLTLWLKSVVASGPIRYDVLEHCVQLQVEESDFYGTGKGIEKYFGIVFLPCTWSLNSGTSLTVDGEENLHRLQEQI